MRSKVSNKLIAVSFLAMIISILVAACGDSLLEVEFEDDPVGNFDALWHEFDRYYALFDVRRVDWDSLYAVYRPLVHSGSTDAELYDAMAGLLSHLQDVHVSLCAEGFPMYVSGSDIDRLLFSDSDPDSFSSDRTALWHTALNVYMDSVYVSAKKFGHPQRFSGYGRISSDLTGLNLGYMIFYHFALSDPPEAYFDAAIKSFRGCDGVILDMRVNRGGSSGTTYALLNRFADKERSYHVSRYRNGPNHGDLSEPEIYYMYPTDNALGKMPLAVLTSRHTASAGEYFTLGAMVLPHATMMGDTTEGVLGSIALKVLPNGWEITLSPEIVTTVDGICYEGIGIPPDIHVMATRAEVDAGRDAVIDRAIELLESAVR
jgi:hypothetical protein